MLYSNYLCRRNIGTNQILNVIIEKGIDMDDKGTQKLAGIFRRESLDRMENPEQLKEYIRVARPGTWILAVSLILVLAALIAWGIAGRIPNYLQVVGVGATAVGGSEIFEQIEEDESQIDTITTKVLTVVHPSVALAGQLSEKKAVLVFPDGRKVEGKTLVMSAVPLSVEEVKNTLRYYSVDWEYTLKSLKLSDSEYWYLLEISLDEPLDYMYWGQLAQANIVISEDSPISYLFQ